MPIILTQFINTRVKDTH